MEEANNNHNQKRKSSWDSKNIVKKVLNGSLSKMSENGRQYPRSETPSSILSSDSDIRFTRKVGSHYRCPCCVAAIFIVCMIMATLSLYVAYNYLSVPDERDKTYRGLMRVVEGDWFRAELADPETEQFQRAAQNYRESLNLWLRRSILRPAFLGSDILAFDGRENEDLLVHFQLRFTTRRMDVNIDDVMTVLTEESPYLGNRTIDPRSIAIMEADRLDRETERPQATSSAEFATTTVQTLARVCAPMELPYCAHFPNNSTSYPNLMGHGSIQDVIDDVIMFREIVDSECYRLAYEFVCELLQPPCSETLILPCKNFCQEFWQSCGARLPPRLHHVLNCTFFPEYSVEGTPCLPKPGCSDDLTARGMKSRLCDGVPDCTDLTDETSCPHCPPGNLLCSSSKLCVPRDSLCNGEEECPDGSDERACLSLAPSITSMKNIRSVQALHYFSGGNVIFTEKGLRGKLCVANLNDSVPNDEHELILKTIGNSLCKNLSFRNAITVNVEKDKEVDSRYVKMENPKASEIKFIPSHCPTKEILSVQCNQLECGVQSTRKRRGLEGLKKVAEPGDWPWHVALFKSGTHICDATIVTLEWLITTASCFQGQSKAEWISRAGSTRLGSRPPWQQERHIVGMVKSPVEGSTIVLLKLERPYSPSDFVRPLCLPPPASDLQALHSCNSLAWAKNRTILQRVELKMSNMERCSNISITTVNGICTDSAHENEDCTGEELAGSPMTCLDKEERWVLAGISNWRIACSKVGDQRPRLYDQTISNVDWVFSTINSHATI